MSNLDYLLQNLSIRETSFRDKEPHLNPIIMNIIKDLNIIEQYYETNHPDHTHKKFVNTTTHLFNGYLTNLVFDSQTYIDFPEEFLNDMYEIRRGISYFISNFNEDNLSYNLSFIKDISKRLQEFVYYHHYISGYLV
tara:strand:+ start:389 stop:799 length:411 start_codon:yes stop_codon:yes gene_type:complete